MVEQTEDNKDHAEGEKKSTAGVEKLVDDLDDLLSLVGEKDVLEAEQLEKEMTEQTRAQQEQNREELKNLLALFTPTEDNRDDMDIKGNVQMFN